ncbi:Thymidylate kinase [Amphibacillus marinus]|uniref:Thymidylate kinase n=1 Tax=Amphibacillus marinus TaxID=872970 RepID=A0A1H8SMC8_9BACI|nr:nucleotide kinase domain-containing protein [Amphibacillus marinus]SEO79725.1 Thymidylate kinase [Amphibacillus marinus]
MTEKSTGTLYIFEGVDNVGKTTIIKKIKKRLENEYIPCSVYSFPGKQKRTLGQFVYKFHHDIKKYIDNDLNNISLQLLHIASHIDILTRCILPDLKQGKTVLLDRSWWSTYAYGIANGISETQMNMILLPEMEILKEINIGKVFLINRNQDKLEYSKTIHEDIISAYKDLANKHKELVFKIYNNGKLKDSTDIIEKILLSQVIKKDSQKNNKILDKKIRSINVSQKPVPSKIYDNYWMFAAKRQEIFLKKLENQNPPFTDDPILLKYRFTNAYRASDRVSQYLIKNIIYKNSDLLPEDILFRILLFKLFNKIETWELLENNLGEITYKNYDFHTYDKILNDQLLNNVRIYSAAYIMPSGKSSFQYQKKHQNNLALLETIMKDRLSQKIAKAKSLEELYNLLIKYPTFGKFLAFQFSIDINYSELCNFSEMSYVVAGPGASSGIKKCFDSTGNYTDEDIIRYMAERQHQEFECLGLSFHSLWGRPLQLIDCQNLFCETDKYTRVAYPSLNGESGRSRIKQLYKPSEMGYIKYFYPPKWNINQYIN